MTFEMRELLWEDYLLDNPKIARRIEERNSIVYDDDFEEMWEESKTEEVSLESDLDFEVELPEEDDIPYSMYGQNILSRVRKKQQEEELTTDQKRIQNIYGKNEEEWEEVDLDTEDEEEDNFGEDFDSI